MTKHDELRTLTAEMRNLQAQLQPSEARAALYEQIKTLQHKVWRVQDEVLAEITGEVPDRPLPS